MKTPALHLWWRSFDVSPDGCWIWRRQVNRTGYALHNADGLTVLAHRWGYKQLVADIPFGLALDHLCHNASLCRPPLECLHRRCVNPMHLEPVTLAENNRRAMRDSCRKGHPWTPESIIARGTGRECRICNNERQRINRAKRKARQV